jgi:hypothetical protein
MQSLNTTPSYSLRQFSLPKFSGKSANSATPLPQTIFSHYDDLSSERQGQVVNGVRKKYRLHTLKTFMYVALAGIFTAPATLGALDLGGDPKISKFVGVSPSQSRLGALLAFPVGVLGVLYSGKKALEHRIKEGHSAIAPGALHLGSGGSVSIGGVKLGPVQPVDSSEEESFYQDDFSYYQDDFSDRSPEAKDPSLTLMEMVGQPVRKDVFSEVRNQRVAARTQGDV